MVSSLESAAAAEWRDWTEHREKNVRSRYGFLALTATVWLGEAEQEIAGVPGRWSAAPGGRTRLRAIPEDGLMLDGAPVDGIVELRPDVDPAAQTVLDGERRLVPIAREGRSGLRVHDPASPAHESFEGIELFPYDPAFAVPGVYTPYAAERVERVPNADGAERGLTLAGEIAFDLGGGRRTLAVSRSADGLSASFGDATNGRDTFGFRFLTVAEPDADGRVVVDFNRAHLPPCAFTDHSLCPLPPVGNRLPAAVTAGERRARFRR
jgi:uncharacterized protein (DUF1684 family)